MPMQARAGWRPRRPERASGTASVAFLLSWRIPLTDTLPRRSSAHRDCPAVSRAARRDLVAEVESGRIQCETYVVVAGVPGNAGRASCATTRARRRRRTSAALARRISSDHPFGQDLATSDAAAWPDDLHVLGGAGLDPLAITAVVCIQPLFDNRKRPETHETTPRAVAPHAGRGTRRRASPLSAARALVGFSSASHTGLIPTGDPMGVLPWSLIMVIVSRTGRGSLSAHGACFGERAREPESRLRRAAARTRPGCCRPGP
jgi:hypothetical protein